MDINIREKILELSDEYDIQGTGDISHHKNDLIILIKHLPFFYDHNDPNYKSFSCRDEAWSAIAEVFKTSKKDVKVQWESLRETYRRSQYTKENNLEGLASGSQASNVENDQILLKEMAYLDNFSRKREREEDAEVAEEQFTTVTENQNEIAEAMDEDTEETEPENTENKSNETTAASTSSANKTKQTEQHTEEKYAPLTVEDLEEKYNLFPDVKDVEDLLFARFIAHELRKITCPIKRLQVQTEILRLIASYAEADSE